MSVYSQKFAKKASFWCQFRYCEVGWCWWKLMTILTCKTTAVFTKVFLINTCFRVSIVLNIAHTHPATLIFFLNPTSCDFHWLSCNFLEKCCLVIKSLFSNLRDLISCEILLTYIKFIWHAPSGTKIQIYVLWNLLKANLVVIKVYKYCWKSIKVLFNILIKVLRNYCYYLEFLIHSQLSNQ